MKITKTLKPALAVIAVAGLLFSGSAKAQKATGYDSQGFRFGIGAEAGIPTGDIRPASHFALGGTARLQYDLKGPVSLMLTSGYTNFFGRDYTVTSTTSNSTTTVGYKASDYGIIPLKAGLKVFPTHNFYISGEAGAGFETRNDIYGDKHTKLILSPGIGFAESHTGLDIGLRYDNYSGQGANFGQVALRVAVGFGG